MDRTLWESVDARESPSGPKRLRWLLTHGLSSTTSELMLCGYAREAAGWAICYPTYQTSAPYTTSAIRTNLTINADTITGAACMYAAVIIWYTDSHVNTTLLRTSLSNKVKACRVPLVRNCNGCQQKQMKRWSIFTYPLIHTCLKCKEPMLGQRGSPRGPFRTPIKVQDDPDDETSCNSAECSLSVTSFVAKN